MPEAFISLPAIAPSKRRNFYPEFAINPRHYLHLTTCVYNVAFCVFKFYINDGRLEVFWEPEFPAHVSVRCIFVDVHRSRSVTSLAILFRRTISWRTYFGSGWMSISQHCHKHSYTGRHLQMGESFSGVYLEVKLLDHWIYTQLSFYGCYQKVPKLE